MDSSGQRQVTIQSTRTLYLTALICCGALIAYCVYRGWNLPVEELILAITILCIAAWPALLWLRNQPYPFPAFETFMLTGITSYVMPLITEHTSVMTYDDKTIFKALICVLIFQLSALFAFHNTRAFEKKTPFWRDELFTRDISRWLPIGLWLHAFYVWVSFFTEILPYDIDSILRAVFFGISTSCSFMLGRKWGNDELNRNQKINIAAALITSITLQTSSLYLINGISSAMVFFLAYISAGRRIPVVALAIVFSIFTILHNGKAPMREKYWDFSNPVPKLTLLELPDFYLEWVEHSFSRENEKGEIKERRQLLDRASLLHILCLVVESNDRGLPHLNGETYGYIPPLFIPRFFWPDKPSGQITTKRLAIHYGLQDESAAKTTSIGFGVLAEAYANFGYIGLVLLGLLIGWLQKTIAIWTRACPLLSNGGLVMILLMAWSIQVELPMSGWLTSLQQAAVCVLGIPYVLKRIFN